MPPSALYRAPVAARPHKAGDKSCLAFGGGRGHSKADFGTPTYSTQLKARELFHSSKRRLAFHVIRLGGNGIVVTIRAYSPMGALLPRATMSTQKLIFGFSNYTCWLVHCGSATIKNSAISRGQMLKLIGVTVCSE